MVKTETGLKIAGMISGAYFFYFIFPGTQINAFTTTPYNPALVVVAEFLVLAYFPLTLVASPLVMYGYLWSKYRESEWDWGYVWGSVAVAVTFAFLAFLLFLFIALASGAMADA